jgi:hypothetical protein
LAELGFFAQELNVGWEEWHDGKLPTHSERVRPGEVRCSCSDAFAGTGEELRP